MPVVIIHYHLDAGGVTQVIARASEAMTNAGIPHLILVGGIPSAFCSSNSVRHIDGLSYRSYTDNPNASSLFAELKAAVNSVFGSSPVTWWFHNHSLGKNPLLPEIVRLLALSHEPIILHIHDLMENGRPQNLSRVFEIDHLYPKHPRIHYVFLNSRDRKVFIDAGIPTDRTHLIPNPTAVSNTLGQPTEPPPHPLVFYPIRGIRRKNLGEILLLSVLAPTGTRFAVSRAPSPASDGRHYDFWRLKIEELSLPVDLNVTDHLIPPGGTDASFQSWIDQSTHWITTSIDEGFGLAYFEAAAFGKPLIGRRLQNIADQIPKSLNGQLYDKLLIPKSWIDEHRLARCISKCIDTLTASWSHDFDPGFIDCIRNHLDHSGYFDFGNLPEDFQSEVLGRACEQENHNRILVQRNGQHYPATEWLSNRLSPRSASTSIESSHLITPENWLRHISKIIHLIDQAPATELEWIDSSLILVPFLGVEQFHFLKCP